MDNYLVCGCITKNNVDNITKAILSSEIDANGIMKSDGFTVLMNIVWFVDLFDYNVAKELIIHLIKSGADVNYVRKGIYYSTTVLDIAIHKGIDIILVLLNNGANVLANTVNIDTKSYGYWVCRNFRVCLLLSYAKHVCYSGYGDDIFVLPYCVVVYILENMVKK